MVPRRTLVGLAVLAWLAGLAPDSARAEWVVSVYLGAAHTEPSQLTVSVPARQTDLAFPEVRYRGESFDGPLYYGARLTRFLEPVSWLGVEVEFIHAKAFANTQDTVPAQGQLDGVPVPGPVRLDTVVQRASVSHGLNLLMANLVTRWPANPGTRVTAVGRVGLGLSIPHWETTIQQEAREAYEAGGAALQFAGGVQIALTARLVALAEYKLTTTSPVSDAADRRVEARFLTHHIVAGVGWRF